MTCANLKANGAFWLARKTRLKLAIAVGVALLATTMVPHVALSSNESVTAGDVVLQFPAPGPSPSGLAWDGQHLWLADESTDTVYKLDPANGKVLASFKAPGTEPRGLVWDGQHLWNLDNGTRQLYKLDRAKGAVLATLKAPVLRTQGRTPELSGLAWDGKCLWTGIVAGWSSRMNQVDPTDGSVKQFHFTKGCPRALASDGTFIWNATDNGGKRLGIVYK